MAVPQGLWKLNEDAVAFMTSCYKLNQHTILRIEGNWNLCTPVHHGRRFEILKLSIEEEYQGI